ncbi:MAG: SH3 domain-containing protein [Clostridia bacterium]|nr:SH3 domain-containing protein [Clostridia bacterium]
MYKTGKYILHKEHMNMRIKPNSSSGILCVIPMGTVIDVLETWDNWGKIKFNNFCGWCCISECFAKPVCLCQNEACCYYEKYVLLEEKYKNLLKKIENK